MQGGKRYLFLILLIVVALVIYIYYAVQNENLKLIIKSTQLNNNYIKKKIIPKISPGPCKIPYLDPFDKSIRKFLFKEDEIVCSKVGPLITSDLDHLYVNEELLTHYNVTDPKSFYCCYQAFTRKDPKDSKSDTLVEFKNCIPFYSKVQIKDEYVLVTCKQNENVIHEDVHNFVPMKKAKNNNAKMKQKLNVLVFGIDSLSRMNYIRQMPKTKQYIDDNLKPISINSYNKVGDNTFPNLIPILMGQTLEEISKTCWPNQTSHFDECHFIWNDYSDAGYLTAFAEDSTWMGLFNYLKRGFKQQPTDYYWRTFNLFAEKHLGTLQQLNSKLCIGPRPTHQVLINYVEKFVLSLKNEPYFGIFWSTCISHDKLNHPALGDQDYVDFFDVLKKCNVLNNTVLIFLSDHGIRWGDIRSTYQGHLEERLPMLNFIFPQWFKDLYPSAIKNMEVNSDRLTSNFDLHETLVDLLNVEELTAENLKKRSIESKYDRGISFFLEIPENRSCEMAGISDHWCTCKSSIDVNIKNTIVQQMADFVVSYINKLLKDYEHCETLTLNEIHNARLATTNDFMNNNKTLSDYTLILTTSPGSAIFETTVRCVDCDVKDSYEVTGSISRINTYGQQSVCMKDAFLKLYCFCK